MKTSDLIDILAVVIATAITAFLVVACWSLLGGLVTYIIALLVGGACIHTWSGNDDI
jgi:membrane protein YqaA with SNARE-associated domain